MQKIRDFFKGIGSLFDLSGGLHNPNVHSILNRTNQEALASDWKSIGEDFKAVFGPKQNECNFKDRRVSGRYNRDYEP